MKESENPLIPHANVELVEESGVPNLLNKIRPHWKGKNLIQRVERLLPVDPSSACQRVFNASVHDLKEKIVLAGLDIASEAARQNKFPEISKPEHVESLDVKRTINLSYYMGLLSRPEWRRMLRVYDIRKDLEHEDDEYEASVEDCVYIFKTAIDVVLSRDPVQLLKLTDVKEVVEQPNPIALSESTKEDYSLAPIPRQTEIFRFLICNALDTKHPDIIRQNSYNVICSLRDLTNPQVIIALSVEFIERIGRAAPDLLQARVAYQSGIFPYLKKTQLRQFFSEFSARFLQTGYSFKSHQSHGELLRNFQEVGGLKHCPEESTNDILDWLILCYIGEPGGYGDFGRNRSVFYSNVGAPICYSIIEEAGRDLSSLITNRSLENQHIKNSIQNDHVSRRFESLLDIFNN